MVYGPIILTMMLLFGSILHGWNQPHLERVELRTGFAVALNDTEHPTGFEFVPALPSLVVPLTETIDPGLDFLKGKIEWNPELFAASFVYPYARPLIGFNPLQFQYALEPRGKWEPYGMAGLGVLHSNIERRETGSDFNFNLDFGIGTRYRLNPKTALLLEYRHIHISNAGIDESNAAIEANTFLTGVSISI